MITGLHQEEMLQAVLGEMVDLRPRDCQIIGARYGLVHDEMTLKECAAKLGITRERVRQIQARGEEELRSRVRRNYPSLFDEHLPLTDYGEATAEHSAEHEVNLDETPCSAVDGAPLQ